MSDAAQAAATPAIMRVDHVSVSFGDRKILDDLSFSMEEGNFTRICGPSGCGKTTIMSVLAGYLAPQSGSCLFDGSRSAGPARTAWSSFRKIRSSSG